MSTLVLYRPRDLRGRVLRFLRSRPVGVRYSAFGISIAVNDDYDLTQVGESRGEVQKVLRGLVRDGLIVRRRGVSAWVYQAVRC